MMRIEYTPIQYFGIQDQVLSSCLALNLIPLAHLSGTLD
jgi:hypothetical protein